MERDMGGLEEYPGQEEYQAKAADREAREQAERVEQQRMIERHSNDRGDKK